MGTKKPENILKSRLRNLRRKQIKIQKKIEFDELESLPQRVEKILQITKESKNRKMTFLVMYDIEDDRVRNEIAKYLLRKGCIRIQKSVYLANLPHKVFSEIHQTLKEVQQSYENQDSIILIPVSADHLKSMKIIGKNINIDLIMGGNDVIIL